MHSLTHWLVAADILIAIGFPVVGSLLFAFLFAVLIDLDILVGWRMGKPRHHGRTWVQEPFGVLLLGAPIGIAVELLIPGGFWLVVVPYASHVLLDYVTLHEVSPFAPVCRWDVTVGFFRPLRMREGHGPSELAVLVAAAVLFVVLVSG